MMLPRPRMKSFNFISYLKHQVRFRHMISLLILCGVAVFQWKFSIMLSSYYYDDDDDETKTKSQEQNQLEHKQYHSLVCTEDNNDFIKYNKRYFSTIKDPNINNTKYIATTKTKPSFQVSLNNREYDKVRWDIMKYGLYYERTLSNSFIEIIQNKQKQQQKQMEVQSANDTNTIANTENEPILVIDVGSNVGWFSLLSASMGSNVHVYSFEATPIHLLRLCESLALNNWTKAASTTSDSQDEQSSSSSSPVVNLYNYAVGENPIGHVQFYVPDIGNPGVGAVATGETLKYHKKFLHTVNMLSLDSFAIDQGWLPQHALSFSLSSRSNNNNNNNNKKKKKKIISILKIDVERYENEVIKGSKQLLQSGMVENIFMELGLYESTHTSLPIVNTLINDYNYYLYKWGMFRGPNMLYDNGDNSTKIIEEFVLNSTFNSRRQFRAINTWWKLK